MHEQYVLLDEYISKGLATFPFIVYYEGSDIKATHEVEEDANKSIAWIRKTAGFATNSITKKRETVKPVAA